MKLKNVLIIQVCVFCNVSAHADAMNAMQKAKDLKAGFKIDFSICNLKARAAEAEVSIDVSMRRDSKKTNIDVQKVIECRSDLLKRIKTMSDELKNYYSRDADKIKIIRNWYSLSGSLVRQIGNSVAEGTLEEKYEQLIYDLDF
jgi:hypothetical protein